jgi:peptide/nickel transport system substrate-binding protein
MRYTVATSFAILLLAGSVHGATLRIGLNEDPDALDPARGGSFVGRVVFAATCDKLIDINQQNDFVPQLATFWQWSPDNMSLTVTLRDGVKFHDGETVAVLADRAGMMISPKALARDVTTDLPCAGPFRLTEPVAQDRIVVDRFPAYWNAGAIKLDRIVYHPQPDTTVRLVNLQAGQLDIVERLGPTDVATVKKDPKLKLISQPALAYYSMSINLAADSPLKDPRVRAALEASIDRGLLNQVVFDGQFIPSNQFEAPGSRYWDPDHPAPPRDVANARALLLAAAQQHPSFTLLIGNSPVEQQVGQVIQSMAAEAGFEIKLQAAEANALVAAGRAGNYQVTVVIWSGRPDPDGNVAIWLACEGFLNWGKYCNPKFDDLLARARGVTDVPQRQALYKQLVDVYLADRPHIVLYHAKWLWALSDKVSGFTPTPDGLIRPQGMTIAP